MSDKLLTIAGVVLEPGTLWVDGGDRPYEFIGQAKEFKDVVLGSLVFMDEDGDPITRFVNGKCDQETDCSFDIVGPKLWSRTYYVYHYKNSLGEIVVGLSSYKKGEYPRVGKFTVSEDTLDPVDD